LLVDKYDGHLIIEKSFANETIGVSEEVFFVKPRHQEIMKTFVKNMYTVDA